MRKGRGEIKKIGNLFEKYSKLLKAPQGSVIESFREVVLELFAIDLKKEKIKYSTYTKILSITGGGPLKSEIKIRKKEILAHMKGRLGENGAPDDIL